jgi:ABC-type transport system substrate-binding protein
MSMALDRNAIAAALVYAKAATAFVPHDTMGVKGPDFNPTKLFETSANVTAAKALLPDAAKGATVKLTLNDDADGKIIGALVETAWGESGLGLKVTVNYKKNKVSQVYDNALGEEAPKYDSYVQYIVKTVAEGGTLADADKCDVVGFEWQMYSADPFVGLASLSSTMCGNGVVFANGMDAAGNLVASEADALLPPLALWDADKQTEYDGLIKAAFEAQDEATRVNKLAAAAGLIADQCPVIPVVFNQSVSVIGKGLSGVEFDYFGIASFTKAKLAKYEKYLVYEDQKSEK